MTFVAFPIEEFEEELRREVSWRKLKFKQENDLYFFDEDPGPLAWVKMIWKEAEILSIASIGDAAKKLKPLAKKWRHVSGESHRRGELILEQLRADRFKPLQFPESLKNFDGGAFTLLSADRVLFSKTFDRPDPSGATPFVEDKSAPSRAYLKLWEALSLFGALPLAGENCVDLGSHPGGWTWVIAKLGANVLGIDRQPLDPSVAKMPGVSFRSGDAFQFTPDREGQMDWIFSDVICYPEKLYEFVKSWVDSGQVRHMICTIKMQGASDPALIAKFQELGTVLHLHHNKHELTWFYRS